MTNAVALDFTAHIAQCIDAAQKKLATLWLSQLEHLLPVPQEEVFPGEPPLGEMPRLIRELAAFFRAPGDEAISSNAVVTATATELGQLRHAQRASVHQVVREYGALRMVLVRFIEEEASRLEFAPSVREVFELTGRLDAAIDVLLQTTVDTFISRYTETITQHTTRLESFNRMVTHELRQPLNALQFGLTLLGIHADPAKRSEIVTNAERNLARATDTLAKLEILSRSERADTALVQHVELSAVVDDIIGQLREMAEERHVEMRVVGPLPAVTADRARLELVLLNLISNAIKYCDPEKETRFVEIAAATSERPDACVIAVHDNGIGMSDAEMQPIFTRFYRGHVSRDAELGTSGMGLGLSIVADCVEALSGGIRVESARGKGTIFFLELPLAAAI